MCHCRVHKQTRNKKPSQTSTDKDATGASSGITHRWRHLSSDLPARWRANGHGQPGSMNGRRGLPGDGEVPQQFILGEDAGLNGVDGHTVGAATYDLLLNLFEGEGVWEDGGEGCYGSAGGKDL